MKRALAFLVLAAAVGLFARAGSTEAQPFLAASSAATVASRVPELPKVAAAWPPGASAKEMSFPEKGKTLSDNVQDIVYSKNGHDIVNSEP